MTVPENAVVTIKLEMTVEEMRALLRATKSLEVWPMFSFKQVLSQSLEKADHAYQSEHVIDGIR